MFLQIATFLLCLCNYAYASLSLQSEFVRYEDLASYRVETPDPRKICPDTGQRLMIHWNIEPYLFKSKENRILLFVTIRFGNRQEEKKEFELDKPCGTIVYDLLNEEYFCKKGLQTYKAEIYIGEKLIDCWKHQLWTEKVNLSP